MTHRITIIGAGFAALSTLRELRKRDAQAEITLVAPRAELHYLPGIIWIPSGLRRREDLVIPLDNFLRRMGAKFHAAEATGLRERGRCVVTSAGEVPNDALVIATGGRFLKKLPGIEHAITPCEGIAAAERIRDRLREMSGGTIAVGFAGNPNEPSAVRGGPMFEFLFGIDTQLRREGRRERFEADKVVSEGGEFAADLILFMPGMTGNAWFDATDLPRSPGGLIQADAHCRVPGFERVVVAGDSGSFPGPDWMPKQAHMADLQAAAAAANLLGDLNGQQASATFKVELICIVDAVDRGTLVVRNETRNLMLPSSRLLHWAKRGFEWNYLRQYR